MGLFNPGARKRREARQQELHQQAVAAGKPTFVQQLTGTGAQAPVRKLIRNERDEYLAKKRTLSSEMRREKNKLVKQFPKQREDVFKKLDVPRLQERVKKLEKRDESPAQLKRARTELARQEREATKRFERLRERQLQDFRSQKRQQERGLKRNLEHSVQGIHRQVAEGRKQAALSRLSSRQ